MAAITVVNQKGGSSKSTTGVHPAHWLQQQVNARVKGIKLLRSNTFNSYLVIPMMS